MENITEKDEQAMPKALAALVGQAGEVKELKYGEGETELIIKVVSRATAGARIEAVLGAANMVFVSGADTVEGYIPAYLNFAKRYAVMGCYTDFKCSGGLENLWLAVNYSPIYDDVVKIVGEEEIGGLIREMDELIKARLDALVHTTDFTRIAGKISGVLQWIGDSLKGLDIEGIIESLGGLTELSGDSLGKTVQRVKEMFAKKK